jgi:hypothetical protein
MDEAGIKKVICKDYLRRKDTDYAIMINGKWGSGKTYFYDHALKDGISRISVPGSNKKYRAVYISLFGISATADLDICIRREYLNHQVVEGKSNKITEKVEKSVDAIIGGVADFFNVDSKRLVALCEWAEIPGNVVLVFDDLERSKIPMVELLGAINKYAVVDKKKVIVISNEEAVDKEFHRFKEKTVRFTLDYTPNRETVFNNIIESRNLSEDYKDYIKNNLSLITETFDNGGCKNLRTFIFFLDIFEYVYEYLSSHCQYKEDFLKGYMLFTIIFSIEYKNDNAEEKLKWFAEFLTQYGSSTLIDLSSRQNNGQGENDNTFLGQIQRYTEKCLRLLMGSAAIANYIQYGGFDESKFHEELKAEENRYELLNKTEYGKTLNKMMDWSLIEDNELDSVLDNVERFLKEDKYTPAQISVLYARYLQLKMNHILCKNLDDIIFFSAIDRRKDNWVYVYISDEKNTLYKWGRTKEVNNRIQYAKYKSLYDYILSIEKQKQEEDNAQENEDLITIITAGNLDQLAHYVRGMDSNRLLQLDIEKFFNALIHSSSEIQYYVIGVLEDILNKESHNDDEIKLFMGFVKNLKTNWSSKDPEIDFALYKYLDIENKMRFAIRKASKSGRIVITPKGEVFFNNMTN